MKIYTKTGDAGQTSLFGGRRVSKTDLRLEAYGTIDELTAALGLAAGSESAELLPINTIQATLMCIGSHLATPYTPDAIPPNLPDLPASLTSELEQAIDALQAKLPPLTNFILPGGSAIAANLHLARTICRRTERRVVELSETEELHPVILPYLNRLSDYLFVAARAANMELGATEEIWNATT